MTGSGGREQRESRQSELAALGRISAELLHDLGNMVALISGRAFLLRDATRRGEAPVEEAEFLLEDCREIQQMMTDLLGEIRSPQRTPEVSFSLAEHTELELNRWVRSAPAVDAQLHARLAHSVRVEGPVTFYTRTLRNLLVNASRFAQSHILVTLHPLQDTGTGREWAVVSVEDDGPGIPPSLAEGLFEPFRRGAGEEGAGWGLGLSLVAWAVHRLGGRVEADRSPRLGGARLRLFLPRARRLGQMAPPASGPVERSSESNSPAAGGGKAPEDSPVRGVLVALVEDDHQVRNVQTRLLQRSGAGVMAVEVELHADPGSLARALGESRADIVLMDLHLGSLTGADVLAELRKLAPELASHTIFLSGTTHGSEKLGAPCLLKGQEWPNLLAEIGQTLKRLGFSCDEPRRHPPT
ncbi:MAG: hybrid sensor histidine kinase/response regulator [Gemmatimonadota bacterium]